MVDNTLVIERYQSQGFEGFIKLSEFEKDANKIPNGPGLFMIIDFDGTGEFLETGGGAFFKGRNPNKPVNELKELWVNDSQVLLIEKASFRFKNQGLRKKISRLIKFCKGQPTGPFYNGRSLAQRSNFNNLTVAWLCLESSLVKEQYNNALIDFIQKHSKTPFATSEVRQIRLQFQENFKGINSFYYRVDVLPNQIDDDYGTFKIDNSGYMLPIIWNNEIPSNILKKRRRSKNKTPLIHKINGTKTIIKPLDIKRWLQNPIYEDYRERFIMPLDLDDILDEFFENNSSKLE